MQIYSSLRNTTKIFLVLLLLFALHQNVFAQRKGIAEKIWTLPYKQCWVIKEQVESVASDNDLELYLSFSDGKIRKIDSNTSETIWENDLGSKISSGIFLKSSFLIMSTDIAKSSSETTTIFNEISKTTGLTNSRVDFNGNKFILLKDFENKILVKNQLENKIILYDHIGKIIWSKSFTTDLFQINLLDNKFIVVTDDKKIIIFAVLDGLVVFEKILPKTISNTYFDGIDNIFAGDVLGNVYMLDISEQKLKIILRTGGKILNIKQASDKILITSSDNFIYLVSKDKGNLIWKKRLSGKVGATPLINKEVAIFFLYGSGKGFVINLKSGKIVNQIIRPVDDFVVGEPILQNKSIIVPFSTGLYKFDFNDCN